MNEYLDEMVTKNMLKPGQNQRTDINSKAEQYLAQLQGDMDQAFATWRDTLDLNMGEVLHQGALKSGMRKSGRKDGRPDHPDGQNYKFNFDGSLYKGKRQGDKDPNFDKNGNLKKNKGCTIF